MFLFQGLINYVNKILGRNLHKSALKLFILLQNFLIGAVEGHNSCRSFVALEVFGDNLDSWDRRVVQALADTRLVGAVDNDVAVDIGQEAADIDLK